MQPTTPRDAVNSRGAPERFGELFAEWGQPGRVCALNQLYSTGLRYHRRLLEHTKRVEPSVARRPHQ